jgi:translation initiation factor 4A
MDKEVAPHSSSNAMRTRASTGCDMFDEKDCSEMEPKRELNMEEITPVEESKKSKKLGACRETEYNNVAAPTINSKKSQISGSRTPNNELITRHTKGE